MIDGFGVTFHGNLLCISYQSDIKLKEVYAGDIEADVEDMIQNVANFLKKEYKKITGDSLSLTARNRSRCSEFKTLQKFVYLLLENAIIKLAILTE